MDKVDSMSSNHHPRRFHWYIRHKGFDACDVEPGTSEEAGELPRKCSDPLRHDLEDLRFCRGGISAKYLSNTIIIALIQEITCGLILATRNDNWFREPQLVILTTCRMFQFIPCFAALLGNYNNNAMLVFPFMASQILIGSYADVQSYLILLSDWQSANPQSALLVSPLLYLALPLLLYAVLLSLVLYIQYQAIQFVNIKKLSLSRSTDEQNTITESLM